MNTHGTCDSAGTPPTPWYGDVAWISHENCIVAVWRADLLFCQLGNIDGTLVFLPRPNKLVTKPNPSRIVPSFRWRSSSESAFTSFDTRA